MRTRKLYHFIDAEFGLEDVREQRIKISELKDLNDPFELLSLELSDKRQRQAFLSFKEEIANQYGVLCFSSKWRNPLLWSHYADKHRGLCLEFEVPAGHCFEVCYTGRHLADDIQDPFRSFDREFIKRLLSTKYASWKYENELRIFANLEERNDDKGVFFADFGDSLRLTRLILGARSEVSKDEVEEALKDYPYSVDRFKARLAFRSFQVVRNRDESLWK